MIALKGDPIWAAISRFGTPWPPFDFGSGMGVEDIDWEEAVELGVLKKDDPPPKVESKDINDGLEGELPAASTAGTTPAYLDKRLFVRAGPQTVEMLGPDLVQYVSSRFPPTP